MYSLDAQSHWNNEKKRENAREVMHRHVGGIISKGQSDRDHRFGPAGRITPESPIRVCRFQPDVVHRDFLSI